MPMDALRKHRRQFIANTMVCTMGGMLPIARAQAGMQTVGLFALLGDSVQVVTATDAPTDTRIERHANDTLTFKNIGFDNIALRVASAQLALTQPQATLRLYRSTAAIPTDEQRALAAGATRGELPAWIVKAINTDKLSHIVLITRTRGDASLSTSDGYTLGRGTVSGIGFYIDGLYRMQNKLSGAVSTGLIGPYVQIHLTLMNAQTGEVLKSHDVRDGHAWAARDDQPQPDPWSFMTAEEKVASLRKLVEDGMARGMKVLLQPA